VETSISVEEFLQAKGRVLGLELLTPDLPLSRRIVDSDVSSPGLALAGYTERVPAGRMQIFGQTEMTYLSSLPASQAADRLRGLFCHHLPAVFVSKGQEVPESFLSIARESGIPVLRSSLSTKLLYRGLKPYLEAALAPSSTLHGTLADVYGVGLLFVGESGVGKSECVLDLIERGHRLVADDLVIATRRGNDVLLGRGHELQRHHMEIRGVGIVDIRTLFGVRAIRQQKRIEVVVQLERWDDSRAYDRTGLDRERTEILGVSLPKLTIPLNPGKNITVISEVVAMNHLLQYAGIDSAAEFDRSLRAAMRPQEYLEEDYE
jgi:HPr kinase/phosphorylase